MAVMTPILQNRLFRAAHPTISHADQVGGSNWPHPRENSLAHTVFYF
jgi:predicted ATPase with chaperone activity